MSDDSRSFNEIKFKYEKEQLYFNSITEMEQILENLYIAEHFKYNYACQEFSCISNPDGIISFEVIKDKYITFNNIDDIKTFELKIFNAVKNHYCQEEVD